MDLKGRIQGLCKLRGVSTNKLEVDLGFGKGYISKLGKSTPNIIKIQAIADYLGVSVDHLLSGKGKKGDGRSYLNEEIVAIAQDIYKNKELRALFDAARNAAPEDLRRVCSILLDMERKGSGCLDRPPCHTGKAPVLEDT